MPVFFHPVVFARPNPSRESPPPAAVCPPPPPRGRRPPPPTRRRGRMRGTAAALFVAPQPIQPNLPLSRQGTHIQTYAFPPHAWRPESRAPPGLPARRPPTPPLHAYRRASQIAAFHPNAPPHQRSRATPRPATYPRLDPQHRSNPAPSSKSFRHPNSPSIAIPRTTVRPCSPKKPPLHSQPAYGILSPVATRLRCDHAVCLPLRWLTVDYRMFRTSAAS